MSIKSKARSCGRMLRRITGLPLPIAMKIGKCIAQGKLSSDIVRKFPEVISSTVYRCGDGCCSYPRYEVKGPKSTWECRYDMTERRLNSDYLMGV